MNPTRLIHLRGAPISGGKLPLICTPLVGRTTDEVLAELAAVLPQEPDLLEWRVDFFGELGDARAVIDTARAIRAAADATPLLFTRRSVREGGRPPSRTVLTLLSATLAASQAVALPLISMAMGVYGSLSRMFGWAFGSMVTFAVGQGTSAPGQMPIEDLRAVLETARKAVLGGQPMRPPAA